MSTDHTPGAPIVEGEAELAAPQTGAAPVPAAPAVPGKDLSKGIQVSNLDLFYGGFHAVKNVNMTIEPFAATALIGSSG